MLVKIDMRQLNSRHELITETEFASNVCHATRAGKQIVMHAEALHWSTVGRVGSRWQIGKTLYVRIKDSETIDDVAKYYTPPEPQNYSCSSLPPWSCSSSSCGKSAKDSNCSKKC